MFNIFVSDIIKELDSTNIQITIKNLKISSIVWADDMVLLADSEENLRKLLKTFELSCDKHKLLINTEKTKSMIFNKSGRLIRRNFFLNGTLLESVRTYKYLGFIISTSGEIRSGLQDLRDRAMEGLYET